MRILIQIPHPELLITVFKSGNKFILKFEAGPFEQTYKFLESDQIAGSEDIRKMVTDELINEIYRIFNEMNGQYKMMTGL